MNASATWAQPQLAAQVLRTRSDGRNEVALRICSLRDARHTLELEQRITALPGVRRLSIDVAARRARVVWDARLTSLPHLLDAFAQGQCGAQPLRHDSIEDARALETHAALKRLLVAGMCAMQVMTYAFVMYVGAVDFIDFTTRGLFRWLSLLTTAPIVFYSAQPFFVGALTELRARRLGINLPVALAVALVFAASAFTTLRGHGEIYFDSVSMFVFLLLGGRYLELRSSHRSGALGDAVMDATPLLAQRLLANGQRETVAAIELLAGDRVQVAEGETIPADGVLESARAHVDEALISGESRPLWRHRGEGLLAGSVLLAGPATLRVQHAGTHTASARLGELAARVRQAREVTSAVDARDVGRFVLRVLALTALTALGWLLVDPTRAFAAAVAVLVVACPCAFALSTPATLTRALGALARRGVLVTHAGALAALARVDHVWFDKTGTLTTPTFRSDRIEMLRTVDAAQAWRWAAALAQGSSHPVARALHAASGVDLTAPDAHDLRVTAGGGITGTVEGRALRLGNTGFALAAGTPSIPPSATGALLLADDAGAIAAFHVDEQPRADAARTTHELQADGVTCAIASGDSASRVAALAARLRIDDWHAGQTPAAKLALLQTSAAAGATTLAVGDGSNDAALLAGADVSAALASGTALAQAHADLLLLDGRLDGLLQARAIARQVVAIGAQSRRWALVYNLCAVPFAAIGLVPPWLAGIGMSLSSLGVVLNAMRVGREPAITSPAPPA
ncbi:MAG: heavy metal translocating P-type ATPase [Rhodanobacter sp.]